MMTIRQAIQHGVEALAAVPDPELDTVALLCHVTGEPPLTLRLNAQVSLTPLQEERFRSLLLLRTKREPLQYLLGTQCFYGYDFWVDRRVLIPRPETETLCELAIQRLKVIPNPQALDVCTGSGAIAVTLKRQCPQAFVSAIDVSEDALTVARENAKRNDAQVRFMQGDLLTPVYGEQFDLIICNPPYIQTEVCDTLQPEVLLEPRLALDGGADGLTFYRRLSADAPACLKDGGHLMVEVGDDQATQVAALFRATTVLCDVQIHRDLYGSQRVVCARHAAFPT